LRKQKRPQPARQLEQKPQAAILPVPEPRRQEPLQEQALVRPFLTEQALTKRPQSPPRR